MHFASYLSNLSTSGWIDLASVVLLIGFAIFGAVYGLSGTLAFLLGMLLASLSAYWLYPWIRTAVLELAICKENTVAAAVFPYIAAFLVGGLIFILLRFLSKRFFQVVIQRSLDHVLGVFAGILKAILVLLIVFSCAYLLPSDYRLHKLLCNRTRTGRTLVPVIRFALHPGLGK